MPAGLRAQCQAENPDFDPEGIASDGWERLERLADASTLYGRMLIREPGICRWLEEERNLREEFRFQALRDEWRSFWEPGASGPPERPADHLAKLRLFRRRMSLRIAYREVNRIAEPAVTVRELSRLAEFCLGECHAIAFEFWRRRFGEPWDDDLDRPARFCVLGLGKLGGGELNFSSDIDLIYLYEGEGVCRRSGAPGTTPTQEFYRRVAESITRFLQEQTPEGFLFRVDLRLRPEGEHGPLVRSLTGIENYYAAAGQTWERLALIKARPVAGDLALGGELLESLHAFRYPRHPPPSLPGEIAAMKTRTEREVVSPGALELDVKSGFGGIREIEFVVQTFQLLHAGRYPFLQTHATIEALDQLERYELLPAREVAFLKESYWFLRAVEHRIQIREERQSHHLPEDPEAARAIAESLGFSDAAAFSAHLRGVRDGVRAAYDGLFEGTKSDAELNDWWLFFAEGRLPARVERQIQSWFANSAEAPERLRLFGRGDLSHPVNREQITRFLHLARSFDALLPGLARPLRTLERIGQFAERYGTRQQFFQACASNPQFFQVLALLFDRSRFIHERLCSHPEILEEVLRPEILRKRKEPAVVRRELRSGSGAEDPGAWLRLYVQAEQIRFAIGELLGFAVPDEIEKNLTLLAEQVLIHLLGDIDPEGELVTVALGKFGGREQIFGSDLDVLFVAATDPYAAEKKVRKLQKLLAQRDQAGPLFELDLRLRPHGDAGPLAVTLDSLRNYHAGSAQIWERQLLTRARVVAGGDEAAAAFGRFCDELLYSRPLTAAEEAEIWKMRLRVQSERDVVTPPERAFKTGPGGLMDFEFAVQVLQLRHGSERPALRLTGTRECLEALRSEGILPEDAHGLLVENLIRLKQIERLLRRDENKPVSVLPESREAIDRLALWSGFPSAEAFWQDHVARMEQTRGTILAVLGFKEDNGFIGQDPP